MIKQWFRGNRNTEPSVRNWRVRNYGLADIITSNPFYCSISPMAGIYRVRGVFREDGLAERQASFVDYNLIYRSLRHRKNTYA
jgi:hypothetical protein